MNTDPNPRIAQAIQQDLAAVGITAELKTLAQANSDRMRVVKENEAPMIWSGGMAWIADYPRSVQFLWADSRLRRRRCRGGGTGPGTAMRSWTHMAAAGRCHDRPGQGRGADRPLAARSSSGSWTTRPGRRCSTSSASPCIGRAPRRSRMRSSSDPVHIPVQLRYRGVRQRCPVSAHHR